MTLKKSFPLRFAQQSPPGLCSQLFHYFQSPPFICGLTEESWREKLPIYNLAPAPRRCNATQHSPALSPAARPISEGKLLSSRADFLRKSYLREIFLSAAETSGLRCLIIYFGFLFYISSLCLSSLLSSTAPPLDPLHHHLLHPPG